jgi:hypothetical protein
MKTIQSLQRQINRIKQRLVKIGDMRPGSLSIQSRSWGGEYCQLSYSRGGRGHTEYIRKDQRKAVERQIANYKLFKRLTQEWVDLEIELCKLKASKSEK